MTRAVASPVLKRCKAPNCRAWKSVDLDVCPFCDRSDKQVRWARWLDRMVITVSLVATAAVVHQLIDMGLI